MDHGEQTSVIENLIYSPTMNSEGDVINLYHLQLQYEDAGNCLELIEKDRKDRTISRNREKDCSTHSRRSRTFAGAIPPNR